MLPRPQVPTILSPCRLRQARTFRQGVAAASEQAQPSHNARRYAGKTRSRAGRPQAEEPNSAFLRGKKFLRSPADALAVIRAVERKYGAVREYRFLKDFELPTHYQYIMNVAFQDPKAFERIPIETETFSVTLPATIPNRPGGVGLDELEPVLQSSEYTESSIPSFGNIMDNVVVGGSEEVAFTIERADTNWYTPSTFPGMLPQSDTLARSFIRWGGFHNLQPISTETPISEADVFRASTIDSPGMRLALRKHSETLHIPNPYETLSATASETRGPTLNWEPLPGHESAPTDTPMPSAIQATSGQPFVVTRTSIPTSLDSQFTTAISSSVTESPKDTTQPPMSPDTSTSIPATVAEVEAIAASMEIAPSRLKQATPPKKKKPQRQGQTLQKNKQNSLRELRNESLQARQQESAKRAQKKKQSQSPTVKEKLSKFFSNIF